MARCGACAKEAGSPFGAEDVSIIDEFSLNTVTGDQQTPREGWLDFGGSFGDTWTISFGGKNNPPITIRAGMMFPCPPEGHLFIQAVGSGQPRVKVWPWAIGIVIAAGRSGGIAQVATGNPKASPSKTHSIGKTTSVVAGAQLTDATYLLAAGAAQQLVVEITADGNNAKGIFVSDISQADAAAFTCPPIYGAGIDEWSVPPGGKLWIAAADTLQFYYAKVRIS